MRKDHRPFALKHWGQRLNFWYVNRFLRPQFDRLGQHPMVHKPRNCHINGTNICAGDYLHMIAGTTKPVSLTTWSSKQQRGRISIGHHCLISPGVEITSAVAITIGDDCMIAAECLLSDSDWHGLYNRTRPFRCSAPIVLGTNVWLGARAIVCKGVSIGDNSVIGAGAVVTRDIPANVVAAGNPARVVKFLDPNRRMLTRAYLFRKGDFYQTNQRLLDQFLTQENRWRQWLRTLIAPNRQD